jgi:hypothetical protein
MTRQVHVFARGALWALLIWAALLFFGTLTHQPDPQTAFARISSIVLQPVPGVLPVARVGTFFQE